MNGFEDVGILQKCMQNEVRMKVFFKNDIALKRKRYVDFSL